jgi:hypothetical protein
VRRTVAPAPVPPAPLPPVGWGGGLGGGREVPKIRHELVSEIIKAYDEWGQRPRDARPERPD